MILTSFRNFAWRILATLGCFCAFSSSAIATTYFVDSTAGHDSNSGTAPSQAWQTLNKVNSAVQGTGHDVLLKSGSVFHNQGLTITWNGAEQDWINIGCFKLNSSGVAIDCTSTDVQPEINGTLEAGCAPSNTCLKDTSGAIPRSSYSGIIDVWANYVAIRNLKLRDIAGKALVFNSDGSNPRHHFLVENVVATHMHSDIVTIGRSYKHGIVRNVSASEYGLCSIYRYPECTGGGWGGGIVVYDSPNAMMLFENNLVHDGFGEAFNCLRSSHVVIRGNRAGNLHSNAFYLDHCSNSVVENNIAWGDLGGRWGANRAFSGVNISNEDYNGGSSSTLRSSINNVIRNNLITGLGYCMDAGQWANAVQQGLKLGFHFYGNTCVGLQRQNIAIYSTTNVDRILVQNNIFYSPGSIEGSCNITNPTGITFQSNLWDNRSVSGPCSSNTDLNQDPQFVTSLADFERLNSSNLPRASHFALSTNSPVWGRGSSVIGVQSVADLLPFNTLVKDSRCVVSEQGLGQDFFCVDRKTPPAIGAFDRSKYPPKPPTVVSSGG